MTPGLASIDAAACLRQIHRSARVATLLGQAAEAANTARVFTELGNEIGAAECVRLADDLRGEAETIQEAMA